MSNKLCVSNFNQTSKNSFICNTNINPINIKDELKLKKTDIKMDYIPAVYKQNIERYENYENLEFFQNTSESNKIIKSANKFSTDSIIDYTGLILLIIIIFYILKYIVKI